MPAAKAGLAPWNKDYEWELSSGWGYKRPEDWDKGIKRRRRKLHDTNGNVYDVYYYPDVDYHLGFSAENDQERLAIAQKAFDPNNPIHGEVITHKGCGHISQIEYAQKEHILRVTFTNNGAVCLFFEVPTAVAGELIHLAKSKRTRHDGRHILGVRFWDYIRIRGTQHGAKYPFEYESHGSGTIVQGRGRNTVTLTLNRANALFGTSARALAKMQVLKDIDANTEFTVVLSDAEMEEYNAALRELSQGDAGGYITPGHSDKPLVQLADKFVALVNEQIEAYEKDNVVELGEYEASGLTRGKAIMKGLKEAAELDPSGEVASLARLTSAKLGKAKPIQTYRDLKKYAKELFGKGVIRSWMQEHYPAEYARRFTGRVWKVQELIDLANPTVEGNIEARHAPTYKRFIQAKDWQGALNYLKTHKTSRTYKDGYGRTKKLTSVSYAGQYDTVEGDY